jgi:hypothetical protein
MRHARSRVNALRRQSRTRRRPVVDNASTYVGLDAHKNVIAVAMLVPDAVAPVQWQEGTTPEAMRRLIRRLRREARGEVQCCYEAGPTGYWATLHPQAGLTRAA